MAKIPEDIQKGMQDLSKAIDTPVSSLLEELKEIINTDETILSMPEDTADFKIRYAWALLYRQHASSGKTVDYYVTPISFPRVRVATIKGDATLVGELAGLVQKIDKNDAGDVELGDVQYGAGTFWRDGAKNIENLEVGKVYKASLRATENSWGVSITSDRTGFSPVSHKMPTIEEFYAKELKDKDIMITLAEMDINQSETTTDIKIIEATIIGQDIGERDDGSEYGMYVLMDSSISGGSFTVFLHPSDVIYAQGSLIKIGGHVNIDKKGIVRWSNHFQLPTDLAIKKDIVIKPIGRPEEVDISLGDDEKLAEKTKEEPKEEPKKKESKDDEIDFAI